MSGSGTTTMEDVKKPPPDVDDYINLKVKKQDGMEVHFKIKKSTQLKKLMKAYCQRESLEFNSIAFHFDGRRIHGDQSPEQLETEDGDEIDAMLHQTGGF